MGPCIMVCGIVLRIGLVHVETLSLEIQHEIYYRIWDLVWVLGLLLFVAV